MHEDLENWLNQVWTRRDELLAASKNEGFITGRGASAGMNNRGVSFIYKMYNDGEAASTADTKSLKAIKGELVQLETEIGQPPEAQNKSGWNKWNKGDMANADISELGNTFFHYRKRKSETVYRIYINAQLATRGQLFREIVVELWKVDGLNNAKVSTVDGRADSIVIYMETEESIQKALGSICAYHKVHPNLFGGALPKLVVPAEVDGYQMRGVGRAMEPPGFMLISTGGAFYRRKKGQSFGSYRAQLIFMALERTRQKVEGQSEEDRKAAFKRRADKYFRRAGIDPDRPADQATPEDLPSIDTIQNWVNTTKDT